MAGGSSGTTMAGVGVGGTDADGTAVDGAATGAACAVSVGAVASRAGSSSVEEDDEVVVPCGRSLPRMIPESTKTGLPCCRSGLVNFARRNSSSCEWAANEAPIRR